MRRAITLAGGGPAAGLHLGALQRLAKSGINFDVWALSCIGAVDIDGETYCEGALIDTVNFKNLLQKHKRV